MTTIPTLDYLADYYDLEPSLFRESENLHKLFQSIFYVCHTQQIDLLWFAENILNIDAAENAHLDFIGSIVGQPRFLTDFNTEPYFGYEGSYQSKTFGSSLDPEVGGYWNSRSYFNTASSRQLNDDEYRRLIKARAIYNQSNCTSNDLLEVINLLSNSKNNTVQMLSHGLIQINTDDSSGIISYFVDRLLNDDNILPIAAGVRVGLEALPTGNGGSDTPETNFLKVISEIIRVVPNNNAGIVYKINNEPFRASIFQNAEHAYATEAVTASAMLRSIELVSSYLTYQTDLLEHGAPVPPAPLDLDASYIFGLNDIMLSSFFSGVSLPEGFEGIEGEVVVTLYPASYLPSVNIDQDLFYYIIDPASYTQADLQYFSERGVTPATKNPDGSYTLKSQLALPLT